MIRRKPIDPALRASRRSRALDTFLFLLAFILVATGASALDSEYSSNVAPLVFGLLQGGPLLFCRQRPLLAWGVLVAGMMLFVGNADPILASTPFPWPVAAVIAYSVVQFAVAVRERRLIALGTWVGAVLAVGLVWQARGGIGGIADISLTSAISGVALVAGDNVRGRREARARLMSEVQRSEQLRARRTLLEERTRIARELHDVVAHHMSVIAVQASTAGYRHPGLPSEAITEFGSIADSARASLTELRRLLTVLRNEDETGLLAPQPGIGDVDELLRATRQAGIEVTLRRVDVPDHVPEAVGLTAYRILQEALSNVVRHAPGAAATVELRGTGEGLELDIINDVPGDAAPTVPVGAGHGLLGMRERVELLGGSLEVVGPDDGAFRVTASLPLTTVPATEGAR